MGYLFTISLSTDYSTDNVEIIKRKSLISLLYSTCGYAYRVLNIS